MDLELDIEFDHAEEELVRLGDALRSCERADGGVGGHADGVGGVVEGCGERDGGGVERELVFEQERGDVLFCG